MDHEINLANEIIESMKKMGFKESSVGVMLSNEEFLNCVDRQPSIQRAVLIHLFYVLMLRVGGTPTDIRVALNIATDSVEWLTDIKLVVLPYLLENEKVVFG